MLYFNLRLHIYLIHRYDSYLFEEPQFLIKYIFNIYK